MGYVALLPTSCWTTGNTFYERAQYQSHWFVMWCDVMRMSSKGEPYREQLAILGIREEVGGGGQS